MHPYQRRFYNNDADYAAALSKLEREITERAEKVAATKSRNTPLPIEPADKSTSLPI